NVLRGRLFDLQGVPAANVRVRLREVSAPGGKPFGVQFGDPPTGLGPWPEPAASDAQGRFTLRGLGANWSADLEVGEDRFARQTLILNPNAVKRELLTSLELVGQPLPSVAPGAGGKGTEDFVWTLT